MQIMFLNPNGDLGGAERSLLDLMASLIELPAGPKICAVVGEKGPLLQEARAMGVRVEVLPMSPALGEIGDSALGFGGRLFTTISLAMRAAPAGFAAMRYIKQLGGIIDEVRPSLVHSNDNKSHILASMAAPRNIPLVWHVRDFVGSRTLVARGLRWTGRRAAGAIAISEAVGRDLRTVLPSLPVVVVHNAIDTSNFTPGPGNGSWLDELAGLPSAEKGTVRIGMVATFGRWKGQDLFLDAAARTLSTHPGGLLRFYIVGGPIYRTKGSQFSHSELRSMAEKRRIADKVGFVEFQRQIASVYRALDIVVHASLNPEPFGRTIVEAMACARPVVVSLAGGAMELFDDGKDAIGFTPGDAVALAAAISSLASDPERRVRIGLQACRTAASRFSRGRLGAEVLSAYDRFGHVERQPSAREV